MALTEERLHDLMYYCRAEDGDAEEMNFFRDLYRGAVAYLENAGVSEPEEDTPRRALYDQVVKALVLDAYDRRSASVDGTMVSENPAFRRNLNQLKLTEPVAADAVSETDTSTEEAGGDG